MRVTPNKETAIEQLHLPLYHTEHTDGLEGRVLRDQKTGEIIVRWATQLPEEKDIFKPNEMLRWLAELSCQGRLPKGSILDVLTVAESLKHAINSDQDATVGMITAADVDCALIDKSEEAVMEAIKSVKSTARVGVGAEADEALRSGVSESFRLASLMQRYSTIDAYVMLHVTDTIRKAGDAEIDPFVAMKGLLLSLAARVYAPVPADLLRRAYVTYVSEITASVPGISLPSTLRLDRANDYAALASKGKVTRLRGASTAPGLWTVPVPEPVVQSLRVA